MEWKPKVVGVHFSHLEKWCGHQGKSLIQHLCLCWSLRGMKVQNVPTGTGSSEYFPWVESSSELLTSHHQFVLHNTTNRLQTHINRKLHVWRWYCVIWVRHEEKDTKKLSKQRTETGHDKKNIQRWQETAVSWTARKLNCSGKYFWKLNISLLPPRETRTGVVDMPEGSANNSWYTKHDD